MQSIQYRGEESRERWTTVSTITTLIKPGRSLGEPEGEILRGFCLSVTNSFHVTRRCLCRILRLASFFLGDEMKYDRKRLVSFGRNDVRHYYKRRKWDRLDL